MMSQSINILYYGGTGGFCLLHTLLLSDEKFWCLPLTYLKNNIFTQWSKDYKNWKSREIWPNNEDTLNSSTSFRKIFFFCNDYDSWIAYPGTKILLYTDIETQVEMCKLKGANLMRYKNPTDAINEATKDSIVFNDYHISSEYLSASKHFDISINLQDLCNQPGVELSKLGISVNTNQKNFLNFWINLHPDFIKQLLLRKKPTI